ncbi:MAG: hypothetical protein JSW25_09130 [Thermoplasmata archaeon]|nr:MAG: hypothetical protein JSW25_09130 [Thermoplasmata archaeon]
MRQPSRRTKRVSAVLGLMVAFLLIAPAQAEMSSGTDVEVDLETSEDVLVMNSDVDLTFTLTDKDTGDPVTGAQVEVHIERQGSGGGGHGHGEPMEVPDDVPTPAVEIDVTEDPKAGWNLQVQTTNFEFAPQRASTERVWGEGHAHLYIDDVKIGRLYTEWYHISGLEKGDHKVRVTLNTNDHTDMAVDGVMVADEVTITQTRDEGHGHMMMPKVEVPDGVPTPQVQVTVHEDPKAGWNVQIETENFRWAPENASTAPVMGEGHAHLYVDDHKVARLYGGWYYLGAMEDGEHQVRVTLNANNHSDYAKDGVVIESVSTVLAEAGHSPDSTTVTAVEGGKAGTYTVSHHFEKAGKYTIEVHVTQAGSDEVTESFELEVLEGDPAPITIAGVILYVVLAIAVIILVQYFYTRRKVRRLQEITGQTEDGKGT